MNLFKKTYLIIPLLAILLLLFGNAAAPLKKTTSLVSDRYRSSQVSNYRASLKKEYSDLTLDKITNTVDLYNYYFLTLFAHYELRNDDVTRGKCKQIVDRLEEVAPESFESYYTRYHFSRNESRFDLLLKAYESNPNQEDIWDQMLGYYETIGDKVNARKISIQIRSSNKYEEDIYTYQSNVLESCESNGIIITQGELDTYPLLVLMYTEIFDRKNIVMATPLLMHSEYRANISNKLKLSNPIKSSKINSVIRKLALESQRPLYLGLTVSHTTLSVFKSKLYLTGLLFKHSSTPIDNVAICENLFMEKSIHLNPLFDKSFKTYEMRSLNKNYLPYLNLIYSHGISLTQDDRDEIIRTINQVNK